jgi:hypothetical protein
MNETSLQWIQFAKLISLAVFAGLYGFGGVSGKWKRRFVAPAILVGVMVAIYKSWWLLLYYPLLVGVLSIGYGESSSLNKLVKNKFLTRGIVGLSAGIAALPVAIVSGSWLLWFLHIGLTTLCTSIFGAVNPFKSARAEETAIATLYGFLPLFMI